MRCVIQRVRSASVTVGTETVSAIGPGLMILVGIEKGDTEAQMHSSARKIVELRIFGDAGGKMNLNVQQAGGSVLAVSQFTLAGSIERGRRPSFTRAEDPEIAQERFDQFCRGIEAEGLRVATGRFGETMLVSLENEGPVTFVLDSSPERAPQIVERSG